MAQTIKLKRSSTGGAVPSTSSLSLGEVAINTYDGKMYIKKNDGTDSIVQIGAGSGSAVWNSYDYTATSSQTSFSGNDNNSESLSYVPGFLQVFLNGILLDPAVDYAATTGSSIVLTVGATTSDLIQIETFTQIIGTGDILVDTFPVSSTQTAFTLSQDPINKSNISVYVEGVYQESSTYSLSTTTLTLSESPANGTTVEVVIGTRNVTLDNIADLTISGTLHAGALDLGDANIINVNEISLDTIKGDADANTNITFAGSDVTTFTQGGTERLRLNTTGAQVTGNIVVSGTVDGRDVAADGVTADAALSRAGGAMGGAITTNSTFDGRDVSVDGTKLDGIESGATADQTDVEIRAAVESASDSNVFTNADHSKLDAIEALADVTDATNVTAAGALMRAGGTMTGNLKLSDGTELQLGDSSEFKIKHHASGYTHLENTVGTLFIDSDSVTFRDDDGSPTNVLINQSGIDVTGSVVADGLTVTTAQGNISIANGSSALDFARAGTNYLRATDSAGRFSFITGASNFSSYALILDASQNAAFGGTISSGAITSTGDIEVRSGNKLILQRPNNAVASIISTDSTGAMILDSLNSEGFFFNNNGINAFKIDPINATFAGTISTTGSTITVDPASGDAILSLQGAAGAQTLRLDQNSIRTTTNTPISFLTNSTSALTLSTSQNVNIPNGKIKVSATTAPVARVDIAGNSDTVPALKIGSGDTYGHFFYDSSATGDLVIKRGEGGSQSESMRLDRSTGNATFSGSVIAPLLIANDIKATGSGGISLQTDEGTKRLEISDSGITTFTKSGGGNIRIAETASRYVEIMGYAEGSANGSTMAFHTIQAGTSTSTERMRLSATGDWMVSNTVANVASNYSTQGGCGWVDSDNHFEIATTSNRAALEIGKNQGNDGDLLVFRKQSTPVASIGTNSGYMVIGSPVGTDAHLLIGNGLIHPATSTGSTKDAAIDLGGSSNRFKDLYITGLDVTYSTYNKISSYFSGTYTSGFKFSDMNGGIWYDAGTDDLTVSAGHANSKLILVSGGSTALTLLSDQSAIFAGTISSGAITSSGHIITNTSSRIENQRISMEADGTLDWGSSKQYGTLTWDTNKAIVVAQAGSSLEFRTNNTGVALQIDTSQNSTFLGEVSTTNAKLKAIAESNTDTAVDVFVYDTRKDSDGGAWRKRTQNTSWYNEALNTATRGARKEFPSVAVIVAESEYSYYLRW